MGRPLKKETIELMQLVVTTQDGNEVLGKQVGFNKYKVNENKIVRLSTELVNENDALLELSNNGVNEPVLKILKNVFQTENGVYAYKLSEEDGLVFEDENVSIVKPVVEAAVHQVETAPVRRTSKKSTPVVEETPKENTEEVTTENSK